MSPKVRVQRTIDIRSDCGHVLLLGDPAAVAADYEEILRMQSDGGFFEVDESEPPSEAES